MTKSKSQLRAEAVERLRDCRYHTHADYIRAMLGWGHEPHFEDSRDALIDLLTDEPTNGIEGETNGIVDGSPLVDRDPVEIMRKAAKGFSGGTGNVIENAKMLLGMNVKSGLNSVVLNKLADMVERDYVSREAYDDLRDEFVWTNTFLHRMGKKCGTKDVPSLVAYVEQLEAEVDEAIAERDYWKDEWKAVDVGIKRKVKNFEWILADTYFDGDGFFNAVCGLARPYYLKDHPDLEEKDMIAWRIYNWLVSPHEEMPS